MDEGGVDEFWKSTIAGDRMGSGATNNNRER